MDETRIRRFRRAGVLLGSLVSGIVGTWLLARALGPAPARASADAEAAP